MFNCLIHITKEYRKISYILGVFLFSLNSFGQVTLFSENFETAANGDLSTTAFNGWKQAVFNSSTETFIITNNCPITGTYSLSMRDGLGTLCDYNWGNSGNYVAYYATAINATVYNTTTLSFNWRCAAEPGFDWGKVCYSTDGGITFVNFTNTGTYNGQSTTQTVTNLNISEIDGVSFLLGFRFLNDNATGALPAFTVDDIVVSAIPNCAPPTAVTVTGSTICSGGSATLTATGGTGGTIYWQNTTSGGTSTADATNPKVVSPAITTTYYYRSYNSATGGCWSTEGSAAVIVVVNPTSTNPAGGTICAGSTHGMSVSPSGGTGTFSYQWQKMATNCATPTSVGTNAANYTTPVLSTGTDYYRCVISQTGSGCNQIITSCATVNVDATTVGGTVNNGGVCGSINSGTVTLSGHTGSVLKWQYDDGSGWIDIVNNTTTQNYSNLLKTTKYRVQLQSGTCAAAFSNFGTVTFDITYPPKPNAGEDQFVCGTVATLAGVGTGVWSVFNGSGTITTPSSNTSGVTGMPVSSAITYRWTVTNVACTSSDEVVIYTQ